MTEQQKKPANTTHVVTTPNKRPAMPLDVLRDNIRSVEFTKTLSGYFAGSDVETDRFKVAVIDYVRRVPKLLDTERISLMSAFAQVAFFKFMPSGVGGEAYIIPYGNEAKFQLGYQGIVTLMLRTGKVKSIKSLIVYDNEKFEYSEGLETTLIHVPTKFGEKRGLPVGVYAVSTMTNGGRLFKVMSKDEVMEIKEMSKAKASKESPWNSDKDPQLWMWKKTCLIQLGKLMPKSIELQKAIEEDYKGEGMVKYDLDSEGPAVPTASHKPIEEIPEQPQVEIKDAEFTETDKEKIIAEENAEAQINYPKDDPDQQGIEY